MDLMTKEEQDALALRLMKRITIDKSDDAKSIIKKIKDSISKDPDKRGRNLLKSKNWKSLLRNILPLILEKSGTDYNKKDGNQKGIFDFG